ncbi:PH domain-containing protein [Nocardioides mesophilus]|uniref:PH domain-containing protein n=1 Tax=Nocardioides mesophilus TaxID=433659 RepID=A0A7G9R8S2_9ACTN|nr:PH domain-containing protein [Nocardioides mesophilus]QNN51997.1 PH domain-containing protein [Nocardioides mesophilus]
MPTTVRVRRTTRQGWFARTFDPKIGSHLLRDEGEVIVDDVHHHWVVYLVPGLEALLALLLLYLFLISPVDLAWVPLVAAFVVLVHACWRALNEHMDRFVITNMRVFRVRGVLSQKMATMPLGRILDITVEKPLSGRLVDYGHFVFESAAQEQGLRDIRFVARPYERDLTIQRVVQRAGLRGPRNVN